MWKHENSNYFLLLVFVCTLTVGLLVPTYNVCWGHFYSFLISAMSSMPAAIRVSLKCAIEMEHSIAVNFHSSVACSFFPIGKITSMVVAFSHSHLGCLYYLVKTPSVRNPVCMLCVWQMMCKWHSSNSRVFLLSRLQMLFWIGLSQLLGGGGLANCGSSESRTEQSRFLHSCSWFLSIFVITLLKSLECYNDDWSIFLL